MNPQEQFWSGPDGDAYTKRNRVDWRLRIPFWHDIMKFTGARSVYEVGCGAGWNLSAIREASPHRVEVYGCDINEKATRQATVAGLVAGNYSAENSIGPGYEPWGYELIFTAGVLIHVAPDNLPALMNEIIAASSRYVLAIEYASDIHSGQPLAEQMVEYRGQVDRLWKRPYGKLYEQLGCKILHAGEATGFDRCQYWLCERS